MIIDELQAEAEAHDVSLEVIIAATLLSAMARQAGQAGIFDDVVAEVAEEYAKRPPARLAAVVTSVFVSEEFRSFYELEHYPSLIGLAVRARVQNCDEDVLILVV